MALLAGLREVSGNVIGIRCALEIFQVARHARRAAEIVVIVDVTVRALARGHGVSSAERKSHR